MNKKIKVTDLINIIAENQDIPQRIRVDKDIYNWDIEEFYKREDGKDLFNLANFYNTMGFLELEVEILEDNTEEIEELLIKLLEKVKNTPDDVIDKVIDSLNEKLRKEKE